MTDVTHKAQQVSPVHSTAAGLAAFIGGAAIAGGCHYVATAKRLAEEGIDPRQRVKAFPVADAVAREFQKKLYPEINQ